MGAFGYLFIGFILFSQLTFAGRNEIEFRPGMLRDSFQLKTFSSSDEGYSEPVCTQPYYYDDPYTCTSSGGWSTICIDPECTTYIDVDVEYLRPKFPHKVLFNIYYTNGKVEAFVFDNQEQDAQVILGMKETPAVFSHKSKDGATYKKAKIQVNFLLKEEVKAKLLKTYTEVKLTKNSISILTDASFKADDRLSLKFNRKKLHYTGPYYSSELDMNGSIEELNAVVTKENGKTRINIPLKKSLEGKNYEIKINHASEVMFRNKVRWSGKIFDLSSSLTLKEKVSKE